jgi:hypothetical protein
VVQGCFGASPTGPLEGAVVEPQRSDSVLVVEIIDQAHLHGVLQALADRGIPLVSVERLGPHET